MENDYSVEKSCRFLDVSSDLSNKSFLISPLGQKLLLSLTFDIQGIYEHITRKDRREKLKNLLKCEASLKKGRYTVKKLIGKGSFGSVVEAIDNSLDTSVAVKIVKLKPGITIHTNNEVTNLKRLNQLDSECSHFVKMLDYFEENGYLCIVLELLHKNLYQFLLELKGLSLSEIAPMAQQLFRALHILENASIVHCDLKPENIMIRGSDKKIIKIVDFGTSCEAGKSVYKFVQSRFYRAPEVALRLEYSLPIDLWSAGCILAELYMGKPLFESRSENSQMSKTVGILGPLPRAMLEKSLDFKKYANLTRDELSQTCSLRNYILSVKPLSYENEGLLDKFIDLLNKCLVYDPSSRIKPQDALSHPFITSSCMKSTDKSLAVPWPSLPYTTIFLHHKQVTKPKVGTKLPGSSSIVQDNSPISKHSTAVSRNSSRVMSSD